MTVSAKKLQRLLVVIIMVGVIILMTPVLVTDNSQSTMSPMKMKELLMLVEKRAINQTIIISVTDSGFIEMALNLWETSYVRFNITNYLFVCLTRKAGEDILKATGKQCFVYQEDLDGMVSSNYGHSAFNRKVMVKTRISLDLMLLGYSVVIVDLDIVFLKNPLPYLTCHDCDLIIQNNTIDLNSGFYLVKPTKGAIELQRASLRHRPNKNDQDIMMEVLERLKIDGKINMKILDLEEFPPGIVYFKNRTFATDDPCADCVIVHNNWIVGLSNKIYKFKEMLLWDVDTDGYYTSPINKFVIYYNPHVDLEEQKRSLDNAFSIAYLLNRTLILPRFTCDNTPAKKCSLLSAFGLNSYKKYSYRESVFLDHHKVPSALKNSISHRISIRVNCNATAMSNDTSICIPAEVKPPNYAEYVSNFTLTRKNLISYSVLAFDSLLLNSCTCLLSSLYVYMYTIGNILYLHFKYT